MKDNPRPIDPSKKRTMTSEPLSDADFERLREALRHEEAALELYRLYAREADDERIKEMFDQFSMNESWHAAAIRRKLQGGQK